MTDNPNWTRVPSKVVAACVRLMRSPQFAPSLLFAVMACEFADLLFEASKRLFWFDELLTFYVSGLQPLSVLWGALKAGVDGMPLGYYLFVRAARVLPGDPLVTLRLPSILGYLMTLLGVYLFARKRLPAVAGLAAILVITLSPFRAYAVEARSYALLVGFLAIAAVFWQRLEERRFMAPLFAIFLTLAVSCHPLAVVTISVFAIAEIVSTVLSHRIRWGVWASCLLATIPFFLSLPFLLSYRAHFGKTFWSQPTWGRVFSTYHVDSGLDTTVILVLVGTMVLAACDPLLKMRLQPHKESLEENRFRIPEIVLVSAFLIYPAILFAMTKLMHSGFTDRYGMPVILGLALGLVYLGQDIWLKPASFYVLLALLAGFVGNQIRSIYRARSTDPYEHWTILAESSSREPNLPVVIGNPMEYLPAVEYSTPELRFLLVQVLDEDASNHFRGADTIDRTDRLLAQFVPLHAEDASRFLKPDQRFVLLSNGTIDWITPYLLERKYNLRLLSQDDDDQIYLVEPGR
jgi:hypothetical protein